MLLLNHCLLLHLSQHPHSWDRATGPLTDREPRGDLDFVSGRKTSSYSYEQPRSLSPATFLEDLSSSTGQGEEEGRRGVEEQKHFWRRSACITDGGKEKEVGEMREALKVSLPREEV